MTWSDTARNARAAAREERCAHVVARRFLNLCFAPGDAPVGADWYRVARAEIAKRFPGQPERAKLFARLIAATSPQADVRDNVKFAEAALRYADGADPEWKPWIRSHRPNVERAIRGEPLSGPKVRAFAAALCGDDEAVVVDTWILRAAGLGTPFRLKQNRSVRIAARAIRIVADSEKIPATEAQARIWFAYRAANWTARKGVGDGYLPIND